MKKYLLFLCSFALFKSFAQDVEIVGTEWLLMQSKELKKSGVPVLHYYTLGKPHVIVNTVKQIV